MSRLSRLARRRLPLPAAAPGEAAPLDTVLTPAHRILAQFYFALREEYGPVLCRRALAALVLAVETDALPTQRLRKEAVRGMAGRVERAIGQLDDERRGRILELEQRRR